MNSTKVSVQKTSLETTLLHLQSNYTAELLESIGQLSRVHRQSSATDLQIRLETIMKDCKMRHRHRIFRVIKSTEFIREHPEMKKIYKQEISDMKKAILLMLYHGYTTETISNILSSPIRSILTQISELRTRSRSK